MINILHIKLVPTDFNFEFYFLFFFCLPVNEVVLSNYKKSLHSDRARKKIQFECNYISRCLDYT